MPVESIGTPQPSLTLPSSEGKKAFPPSRHLALTLFCACASLLFYLLLSRISLTLTSAEPTGIQELFPWITSVTHRSLLAIHEQTEGVGHAIQFLGCCIGLFAIYGFMLRLARGRQPAWFQPLVFGSAAAFMAVLLLAPVMLSSDAYAYAYYGRILSVYHADAHAALPEASLSDPFLGGWYGFVPSVYGPLWTLISAGLDHFGGAHIGLTLLLFRSLEAAAVLGCALFIRMILRRTAPERVAQGIILFLWNPVVIIESAMSGHNDTVMMFFALLAICLHLRGWKAGAALMLLLSALVKAATGPLMLLYILLVLRTAPGWRERALFLARAGLGAALLVAAAFSLARIKPEPTLSGATSPDFYENNYHELIFKGIRRWLGEDSDSIQTSMDFGSWWISTTSETVLRDDDSETSAALCQIPPRQPLLVIADQDSDTWLSVYDPANRKKGYVDWPHVIRIADPPGETTDPELDRLESSPQDWPTVVTANRWIRWVTWSLMAGFGLLVAWKAADFDRFLLWSIALFLAAQLLIFTRIWQWYLIWPLALGALKPASLPARLALFLSAGMLTLYVWFECEDLADWLYTYRSVWAILLPVLLFAILYVRRPALRALLPFSKAGAATTP